MACRSNSTSGEARLTADVLGPDWKAKKAAIEAGDGDYEAVVLAALAIAMGRPVQGDLPLGGDE